MITSYDTCRNSGTTETWANLNINIRTALLSKLKDDKSLIGDTFFWANVCTNNFEAISEELKGNYSQEDDLLDLHEAYLIDSVTQECNKTQSINFLVDESGSIGSDGFEMALHFL